MLDLRIFDIWARSNDECDYILDGFTSHEFVYDIEKKMVDKKS